MRATSFYKGHKTITFNQVLKNFQLTRAELLKLIGDGKLKIIPFSKIYLKEILVNDFFATKEKQTANPIVINAHDLIVKFNLDRADFSKMLTDGKLKPLPIKDEVNLYFGYKEACALLSK